MGSFQRIDHKAGEVTASSFAGAMLRARLWVASANPGLLDWAERRWTEWLRAEMSGRHGISRNQFTVIVSLSCLGDLHLHAGLTQLLAAAGDRCSIVLSALTEELAQIMRAQARRAGWEGLVQIVAGAREPDVLRSMAEGELLVAMQLPTVLPAEFVHHVAANDHELVRSSSPVGVFVGHAASYSAPLGRRLSGPRIDAMLSELGTFKPSEPTELPSEQSPAFLACNQPDWSAIVHSRIGLADLPSRLGGEVRVTSNPGRENEQTIVRRRVGQEPEAGSLRLRAPPGLLTETGQPIRLERQDAHGEATSIDLLFRIPPARLKPWMISAFLNRGGAGNPVIRAFAQGTGCRIGYAEDEPAILHDIPVVWGVLRDSDRILAQAKAQGLYFFYIDHAYFNRGHGKAYRVARNAYEAGPVRRCPQDRLADLQLEIEPWRKQGRDILVCPPTDYFMRAHGCEDWLETTLATLKQFTDRPVIVRAKPRAGETAVPLPAALKTAHALVTHSSNVAIEAACLGTPVFVAPSSAAAPVGRTDLSAIEKPTFPDRQAWLAHLAYSQYSFEEFGDGTAWRLLLELEERELA